MKIRFKYVLSWLVGLFLTNPVKLIFLVVSLLVIFYLTFWGVDDLVKYYDIVAEVGLVKKGGSEYYLYVYENGGLRLFKSETEPTVVDGYLESVEYHPINVVLWTLSCGYIFTISLLTGLDTDGTWDKHEVSKRTILNLISCEFEEGKYYYLALGRLLGTFDKKPHDLLYHLNVWRLRDILICPKFKTKSESRKEKLKTLGI